MPISINGSGTVTGISVGGLPDSIVDTDMLAANAVSAAKLASGVGGKIMQVVTNSTNTAVSNNSNSYADTGLSCSITPLSASSKILVQVDQQMQINGVGASNGGFGVQLLRGSTVIVNGGPSNTIGPYGYYFHQLNGNLNFYLRHINCILDGPSYSVGDTLTYKTQMRRYDTGVVVYAQVEDTNNENGVSRMTLMEVAA